MTRKAVIKVPGNTFVRIDEFDDNSGTKAGYQLLDVEEVRVNNSVTGYPDHPVVTQDIVNGKWRVTTTINDLTGPALDAAKDVQVGSVDKALAGGLKDAFNAIFFLVNDVRTRHGQATITLAQFKTQVDNLTGIDQTAFNTWLKGKI